MEYGCAEFFYLRLKATCFLSLFKYTECMKTVYVEDMFLLNFIINYFIILATAKLCALPLKRGRFAIAAALGAAYSVLTLLPALSFLATVPMKLALGVLMTLIAFGNAKHILRPFIAFMCVSAAFGGAVFAASMLAGADISQGLYINTSMRVLLLSFAACYLGLTLVFKQLSRRRQREVLSVKIALGERKITVKALKDTGNELFDPLSGLPVIVVQIEALYPLLPEISGKLLGGSAADFLSAISENENLKNRFRLVPYTSMGTEHGLLPVFRPDKLWIEGKEQKNLLVGVCGHRICPDDEFSAVL